MDRAVPPLCSLSESQGGWIELQPGPFQNKHWQSGSLFIDMAAEEYILTPLARAIPGFDIFSFYTDLSKHVLSKISKELLAHSEHSDPLGEDIRSYLAEWIEEKSAESRSISILGV